MVDQAKNKTNTLKVNIDGKEYRLKEAYELFGNKGVSYLGVRARIVKGWNAKIALTKGRLK